MRRALILFCLTAGCGLPDLDTPATRASVATPYPDLAPRSELLSRIEADTATGAGTELSARSAGLAARGNAGRAVARDPAGILVRADGLRTRAQGLRDQATPDDASSAADLRQRAETIRADRATPAATVVAPDPAETDADDAERLRRLRLLRDETTDAPL